MYLWEILNQIIPVASLYFPLPGSLLLIFLWWVLSSLSQRSLISVFSKYIFSSLLFFIHSFSFYQVTAPHGKSPQEWFNTEGVKYLILGASGSSISPCNEYSVLISLRIDWVYLQGTLKSLGQHHNLKASVKRCLLLRRKAMTNLDTILKSRDITLPTKVHLVKLCSHVQMWELDHKEDWTLENWCFQNESTRKILMQKPKYSPMYNF